MRFRTLPVAGLLAALLLVLLAGGAQAHSLLVSSTPAAGAKLNTPPASVVMTFSEGVEPAFSSFVVLDRARTHYELSTPPTIDRVKGLVTVPLQPNLPAGAYVVQWKVVSVVDGHLTRGSFAFQVLGAPGAATPPPAPQSLTPGAATPTAEAAGSTLPDDSLPPPTSDQSSGEANAPSVIDVIVRWLGTLLAACLVGGTILNLLVVPGAVARLPDGGELRARLQMRFVYGALAAAWLLIVTLCGELLLQAMRATETDLGSVFAQPGVFTAVLNSSFGASLEWRDLAALAIFAVLVAALVSNRVGRWLWALLLLLGAGYFWAATGSAHATALSESPSAGLLQTLAPFANLVHLLATAVWIGGIFYFVAVLLPLLRGLAAEGRAAVLRTSVARFSQIALVTVPVVALSGLLIYLAEQPSVASTLDTGYGREVLIKVGLLAVLMIPAAYNLRRVGPGLARLRDKIGPAFQALARGFRRSIRAEALLVSTVLIFSALLTLSAPATDPAAYAGAPPTPSAVAVVPTAPPAASPTPAATATTAPPAMLTLTQTVRGVDVALTIVHSGVDDISVNLRDAQGPISACAATPAAGADCALNVKLTFTELDDNTSSTEVITDTTNGSFALPEGPYLPLDGTWQITVVARRYNQPEDVKAAFRYDIAGNSLNGKVSDYINVVATTKPDPPVSGPVDFVFHLTDNNGQLVNDATVTVQGIMPTHGHVTELQQMKNQAGAYSASLLMPMSGGWDLELSISRPGHDTLAAEVAVDLGQSAYDLTPYPSPNITPSAP